MKITLQQIKSTSMGCRIFLLFTALLFCMGPASSQALLTPEEAIDIALNNSFGVLVARNNADIARINNTIGAAGMLPNINGNANANFSQSNVELELSNNSIIQSSQGQTKVKGSQRGPQLGSF